MGKMPFYIRHSIVIQFVPNKVELKVELIIGKVTCLKKIVQIQTEYKQPVVLPYYHDF